jgi:hypothetical protein
MATVPGNSASNDPSVTDPSQNNGLGASGTGNTGDLGSTARSSRICTDTNGIIYSRGQSGFERCLSEKGTSTGSSDQMGGTLGGSTGNDSEIHNNPDSSLGGSVPGSDTGVSTDSSGSGLEGDGTPTD